MIPSLIRVSGNRWQSKINPRKFKLSSIIKLTMLRNAPAAVDALQMHAPYGLRNDGVATTVAPNHKKPR
jgi:hypothetical protein